MALMKHHHYLDTTDADVLVPHNFTTDYSWSKIIKDQGFFKMEIPKICGNYCTTWTTRTESISILSGHSRKHFQKLIQAVAVHYIVRVKEQLNPDELDCVFNLYQNVKAHHLALNTYTYSKRIFEQMNTRPNWEFILWSLKAAAHAEVVGVMLYYRNKMHIYVPALINTDYRVSKHLHPYRKLLFQTVKRDCELGVLALNFGVSASFEKRKLGATVLPKIAIVKSRDN